MPAEKESCSGHGNPESIAADLTEPDHDLGSVRMHAGCVHVRVHLCSACDCARACVCVHVRACMRACVRVWVRAYVRVRARACI